MSTLGDFHRCARANVPILEKLVGRTSWDIYKYRGAGISRVGFEMQKLFIHLERTHDSIVSAFEEMNIPNLYFRHQEANPTIFYVCDIKNSRTPNAAPKTEKDFLKWARFIDALLDRHPDVHERLVKMRTFVMVFVMWFFNKPNHYRKRNTRWAMLLIDSDPVRAQKNLVTKERTRDTDTTTINQRIFRIREKLHAAADELAEAISKDREYVLTYLVNNAKVNHIMSYTNYHGEFYQGENKAKKLLKKIDAMSKLKIELGTLIRRRDELATETF